MRSRGGGGGRAELRPEFAPFIPPRIRSAGGAPSYVHLAVSADLEMRCHDSDAVTLMIFSRAQIGTSLSINWDRERLKILSYMFFAEREDLIDAC